MRRPSLELRAAFVTLLAACLLLAPLAPTSFWSEAVAWADDDDDDDDDGGSSGGGSTGGGSSGGGSSGGGSTGGGGSSGGGSTGGGSSGGGSAGGGSTGGGGTGGGSSGGGSAGGGSTGGGGSSGGGSTGGGSSGGGGTGGGGTGGGSPGGGGGTPDDGDDDDDDGRDDDRGTSGDGGGRDRDDRDDRTGGDDGDRRSGLARLRDFLFGRTDPPADRDDRFRPGEILAVDLSSEARGRLVRLGFEVLDQRRLATLGVTVTRLAPPSGRPLLEALELARSTDPATVFDLNHLYRGLLCEGCWASAAATLRLEPQRCRVRTRLGLLDTAVDTSHPALARARIRSRRFVSDGIAAAAPDHGTAVASLLVGTPMGLLPEAELLVAEIFGRGSAGAEADALALASGLDWLVQGGARIVNASLAGPANRLVELAVYLVKRRGVVLVAAAGNGGPAAPPAYPAAIDGVIAVTAVDQRLEPWRKANRGAYIAFAAPGVDVPVAAPGGGLRPASGTSFAAPFVTAALAAAAGGRDPRAAFPILAAKARDLGAPGRDPVFGHGLVQAVGCRS